MNLNISEGLTKPLHEKLKVSLAKRQTRQSLASRRVRVSRNRNMVIIIGQRNKTGFLVILQFQKASISPLTGILKTTADTAATGNPNKLRVIQVDIGRRTKNTKPGFSILC